jgi:long-chain acyl-CoA synthetase
LFTRDAAGWEALAGEQALPDLREVVVADRGGTARHDRRLRQLERWMQTAVAAAPDERDWASESARAAEPGALATIVYTSGDTGRPKGVMLSAQAVVSNVFDMLAAVPLQGEDLVFSMLPLAHLYGRSVGVYAAVAAGATLIFARGTGHTAEDLASQRPTVLVGVPRLYERIHGAVLRELEEGSGSRRFLFRLAVEAGWAAQQPDANRLKVRLLPTGLSRRAGQALRQRLGGRLRLALSGGAGLSPQIGRMFNALGIPLLQGYGLTEAGPVVSVNRLGDNDPASVGRALDGVETRVDSNGELLVRSPSTMLGYWQDEAATRQVLDESGWLRTGDKVSRLEPERIYLVGRFKELLITATGEKISAADVEARLMELPLVEQVMVVGEARPYLSALIVPQPGPLALLRAEIGINDGDDSEAAREAVEQVLLERCQEVLRESPRNHCILRVALVCQPWTVANACLTSTQKLRRCEIKRSCAAQIEKLYRGHYTVAPTDCSSNAAL